MTVVSTLLTQTDKLAVSKMLSLEMLGYYTLAVALASVPLMLASPIATAVFPRLTGLAEVKDHIGLVRLYHRTCELVAVAIIPAGLTLALFAGDFILAWTGSAAAAQRAGLVASLLLLYDKPKVPRMIKRKWTKKSSKFPIIIVGRNRRENPVGYPAGRRHAPNEPD